MATLLEFRIFHRNDTSVGQIHKRRCRSREPSFPRRIHNKITSNRVVRGRAKSVPDLSERYVRLSNYHVFRTFFIKCKCFLQFTRYSGEFFFLPLSTFVFFNFRCQESCLRTEAHVKFCKILKTVLARRKRAWEQLKSCLYSSLQESSRTAWEASTEEW